MEKRRQILGIVNRFVNYIDKLSDEEIDKIESKEATIKFEFINHLENDNPKRKTLKTLNSEPVDVDTIINSLNGFSNRREGEEFLLSHCQSRFQMEKVAKKLDVPFQKKESNEHLRNKIIEGTIGYRLRSQAIKTNSNFDLTA